MHLCPRELCSSCKNGVQWKNLPGYYDCNVVQSPVRAPSHCFYYDGPSLPVDVVIITAVQVELVAVLEQLHSAGERAWSKQDLADGIWYTSLCRSKSASNAAVRVAVAKASSKGLPAAAALTALAIKLFRPTYVVMVGITAGRREKTKIGDIIVPSEVWDYGAGKWDERSGRLIFRPRLKPRNLWDPFRQRCEDLARKKDDFTDMLAQWLASGCGHKAHCAPQVRIGPMVSGAAVVNAGSIWKRVLQQSDEVLALDMEAYGVALAADCAGKWPPRWLIAKSVCDFGEKKEDDAQEYAAFTSVRFFRLYLEKVILSEAALRNNVPPPDHIAPIAETTLADCKKADRAPTRRYQPLDRALQTQGS